MAGVMGQFGQPLTYLRVVYLLLGSGLAVAIGVLDVTLAILLGQYLDGWAHTVVVAAVVVAPVVIVACVAPTRQVEAVAAESLLGVTFSGGVPGPARTLEERARSTVWFVLHLLAGAVVVIDLAVLVPLGLAYVTTPWRVDAGEDVSSMGWLQASGGWSDAWLPAVGVALLVIAAIVPVALGGVLGRAAPALLGPSYGRRLEQLEHETVRLVERTRIARELHDSIGHTLSVVVLQSAAARRQLGAAAELDHVLGLLREDQAETSRRPALGLDSLGELVTATERAGLAVRVSVGDLGDVPTVVSREAYRIVQEGLPNALRHSTDRAAELELDRRPDRLVVVVSNPAPDIRARRAGRGLAGMAERVEILGGWVTSEGRDGVWRLEAHLPLPQRSGQPT